MTQEEKSLLLKDLCARLLYGVIVDYRENEFEIPHWKITTIHPDTMDGWIGYNKRIGAGSESGSRHFNIGEVKPYLRPLSSMTDEEKHKLLKFGAVTCLENGEVVDVSCVGFERHADIQDYLNAHHFDYRGLIEKGLALEAPEGMYK